MLFALSANPTGKDFREDFAMRSETKPSQDEEKNGQEPLLPPIQPVIDFGSVVIKNSRAAIHCLTIAGSVAAAGAVVSSIRISQPLPEALSRKGSGA